MPRRGHDTPSQSSGDPGEQGSAPVSLLEEFGGYGTVHRQLAHLAEQMAHPEHLAAFEAKGVRLLPHGLPSILVGPATGEFADYAEDHMARMNLQQGNAFTTAQLYVGPEAVPIARQYFDGILNVLGPELQPDQLAELQALLPQAGGETGQ